MEVGGTAFHLGEPTGACTSLPRSGGPLQPAPAPIPHRLFRCGHGSVFAELGNPFPMAHGTPRSGSRKRRGDTDSRARSVPSLKSGRRAGVRHHAASVPSGSQASRFVRGSHDLAVHGARISVLPRLGRGAAGLESSLGGRPRGGHRGDSSRHRSAAVDSRCAVAVLSRLTGRSLRRFWSIDMALQALADGFADIRKTEERCWEPELHRLRGELLRSAAMNRGAEAEVCFLAAIETARGQGAKSLESRASVSLARHWRDQDRRADAHRLVADVFNWFTEGFETPDLKDASSLLKDLAP